MLTIWVHSVTAGFQIGPAVARVRMGISEITLRVSVLFPNVDGAGVEGLLQFDPLLEAVETSELLLLIILYFSMVRLGEPVVVIFV